MKTLAFVPFLLILTSSFNCETPDPVLPACEDSKIVSEVSDRIGIVSFDRGRGYTVTYYFPNTYDSGIYGVFCNLPEDFKKDGLPIRYSGKYKEREKGAMILPVGLEIYTLELTKIAQTTKN